MKLNALEFTLINNPVRAASQAWLETPLLIGTLCVAVGNVLFKRLVGQVDLLRTTGWQFLLRSVHLSI